MPALVVSLLLTALAAGAAAAQPPATTRVVGRVLDAKTKEPLAGATVAFHPITPAAQPGLSRLDVRTDDKGVFGVDALPGRYQVIVNQPGFVGSNLGTSLLNRSIRGAMVNLGDIRLARAGAIEGRVFDPNGSPMPRVVISIVPPGLNIRRGDEVGIPVGSSEQTNDLGVFHVGGVPTGRYYVVAMPTPRPQFNPQAMVNATFVNTYYPGSHSSSAARLVEVVAGNTTKGIEFRLVELPTVMVSGVVVNTKPGWPVPGARVTFLLQGDRLARSVTTTTQADGTFTVALPDGEYRAEASRAIVVATANGKTVRYERSTKSVKVNVEGRPVTGIKVVADR
jgi:hypothetical protein